MMNFLSNVSRMLFQGIVDREVDKHTFAPLKLQQFGVQESK